MDLPRVVLGSLVLGLRPSQAVSSADMATSAQRRLLAIVEGIRADALEPTLELVHHRAGDDVELSAELAACEPQAVFSERTLDGLVKELRKAKRAEAIRAGAVALARGVDARAVPEQIQEAVRHLAELAKPQDAERGPSHVSVKLGDVFLRGKQPAVPFGLDALGPLDVTAGQLCCVGARPGVGKTAFLGTVAQNAAERGWDVLFVSLEMPALEIQQRLLAGMGGLSLQDVKDCTESRASDMVRAAERLADLPIWVEDGNEEPRLALDLEGIGALVAMFAEVGRGERPRVVLVDYLQYVRTRVRVDRRNEAVGHVCRELKRFAKDHAVPIIVAAQLNRLVEQRGQDARPQMSDLAESSDIEKNADKLLFLHRTEPVVDRVTGLVTKPAQAFVKVAKNRQGPCWTSEVRYVGEQCRFEDMGTGWQ